MNDVLIPLGLLLFIGFFAFAIIHTARKQRKAKAKVYRDFAENNGVPYLDCFRFVSYLSSMEPIVYTASNDRGPRARCA